MTRIPGIPAVFLIAAVSVIGGCAGSDVAEESEVVEEPRAAEVEESGEESGTELPLNESYDTVRNGARLTLAYDAQSNSFKGRVENTTNDTLRQVRVEVHLSNGRELGPTTPADLAPGEGREVELLAASTDFDGWTAHPEVGSGEHAGAEEHGEEHGGEERREHDREGGDEHR